MENETYTFSSLENTTKEGATDHQFILRRSIKDVSRGVIILILVIFIVCGNSVILSILNSKIKGTFTGMRILLSFLAGSDILHGLLVGIPEAVQYLTGSWLTGGVTCRIYSFARTIVAQGSIVTLIVIGIERFNVMRRRPAQTNRGIKHLFVILGVIFTYLILSSIPYLIVYDTMEYADGQISCIRRVDYPIYTDELKQAMVVLLFVNFGIPLVCLATSYSGVVYQMWKSQNKVHNTVANNISQKQTRKVVTLCLAVMMSYLLLTSPWQVALLLRHLFPANKKIPQTIGDLWIGSLIGSAINPFIYGVVWKEVRVRLKKMLARLPCCKALQAPDVTLDSTGNVLTENAITSRLSRQHHSSHISDGNAQ